MDEKYDLAIQCQGLGIRINATSVRLPGMDMFSDSSQPGKALRYGKLKYSGAAYSPVAFSNCTISMREIPLALF